MDETSGPATVKKAQVPDWVRWAIPVALLVFGGLLLLVSFKSKVFFLFLLALVVFSLAPAFLRNSFANLSLALASISAALFVLEAALYVTDTTPPPVKYQVIEDPSLSYVAKPGKFQITKVSSRGDIIYKANFSIAPDGFRSTPQTRKGARSAYFLGCSFLYGEGLADNETLPYYFAEIDPGYTVKNYGMHGYGPSHNLVTLDERIKEREALVVILTAPWHAFRSACIPVWLKGSPRFVLATDGTLKRDGVCDPFLQRWQHISILRHSKLYQAVLAVLEGRAQSRKEVLDLYLGVLKELKRVTDARSQRLIVAFMKGRKADVERMGSTNAKIMHAIKSMGIELVDVTLAPTIESLPREYYISPLDLHPSAAANKRRAELVAEYLRVGSRP